jgi:hypothetical protein
MKQDDRTAHELLLPDGSVLKINGKVIVQATQIEVVEKKTRQELALYRRNAMLLSLLVLLAGIWFYRHVQSAVSNYLIGIPALVAAWQIASATAGTDLGGEMTAFRKKLLARRWVTRAIAGGYVVAALALLFTASFFVELGSGEVKEATVRIVDANDIAVTPAIRLDSRNPAEGRVFFPRLFSDELRLVAAAPEDYVSRRRTPIQFRPMSAERVTFATDFEKKHHRIVVIVPGLSIRDPLANSNAAVLKIKRRTRRAVEIHDFVESTVVTGVASAPKLAAIFEHFDQQELPAWLARELVTSGVKSQLNEAVATARQPTYQNGNEFIDGETITISLVLDGVERAQRTVTLDAEVTPIRLEIKP